MLRFFTYTLISLFISITANAADLAILPVGLSLASSNSKGMITVSNRGKESIVIQAEAVSWTQADGKDEYAPTRELLVNPPLFTIPPGRSQVLRVGLRQVPSSKQETAYRLLLREVPPPLPSSTQIDEGKQGNIRVLLQVRLPVYITPAATVHIQQWQAKRNANGTVALKLSNTGNVHTLVSELKLRSADESTYSPPLAIAKAGDVVFPGQSHSWDLKPQEKLQGQRFVLEVKTDRGQQNVPLDLGPP
ncbi:MAG: fimbrial biogenesis chaperone [Methylotenera sp.]